jgi:hypothetical protein
MRHTADAHTTLTRASRTDLRTGRGVASGVDEVGELPDGGGLHTGEHVGIRVERERDGVVPKVTDDLGQM